MDYNMEKSSSFRTVAIMDNRRTISEYVASDEFKERMHRVSAQSRPFGNSTPSEKVYEALAKASSERKSKSA